MRDFSILSAVVDDSKDIQIICFISLVSTNLIKPKVCSKDNSKMMHVK